MDMVAAITVAASEIIIESAAICITSGSRVTIRFNACNNPDVISLIDGTAGFMISAHWFYQMSREVR
jgi:hypothetical protein